MGSDSFDVIVIGSGFGGAVAANRLALAGKRVVVLERGPWRDSLPVRSMGVERRSPYPYGMKAFTQLLHSLYGPGFSLPINKTGMFELGSLGGVYGLAASGVGGGSTAYGGLVEAPRNTDLWKGRHPELDASDIERHYPKIIDDLGGCPISRTQVVPQTIWDHFPDVGHPRCRPADVQPCSSVLTPTQDRSGGQIVEAGGIRRAYCASDGDSFLGSRGGAKASVDFVYLAPVLGRGVTVRDLCQVEGIRPRSSSPGTGYVVGYRDLAERTSHRVEAPRVVLAAGTLNTLRLLFRSVDMPGGLTPMPALGQGFFCNGDLIGVGIKASVRVPSFQAAPVLGALTVAGFEDKPIGMGGLPGFQTWPLPGFVKRRLARSYFMYAMGSDSTGASVRWVEGRLRSDYDYRREPIYEELRAAYRVVGEVGGFGIYPLRKPISPHMGGGARIGTDARAGVVDHRGEVYGNAGLHIADASVLPAAPGGPPSVSIAAWAHHVADRLALIL